MTLTNMNRWQALAVHLGISLLIFIVLCWAVFYVWFPGIFFDSENGLHALLLIAGVDLILGPMLTCIVFNPSKKSLRFDLAVIAIVQLSALIAGGYVLHQQRPVAVMVIDPSKGAVTLYAPQLTAEAINWLNGQPQQLYIFSNYDLPEVQSGKINIKAAKIELQNLEPISTHKGPLLSTNDEQPLILPLDLGQKDNASLQISPNGQLLSVTIGTQAK